jgi:putative copper resistance protein D
MQTALIVCRFLHFGFLLPLFGICLAQDLLLRSSLGRTWQPVRGMRWLTGLALLTAVGWLMLAGASMAGSWSDGFAPENLLLVLGHTSFGKVWAWHIGLNLLLLALLLMPQTHPPLLRLLLAALLLATLAPVGHVAMFDGLFGQLLILNQLIHLMAVSAWLGGLCLLLVMMMSRFDDVQFRSILLRFSGYGYAMVALIIGTGLINVRVMSGASWPTPAFSGFGLILAIKVGMVLCMLALALFNRLMIDRSPWRPAIVRTSITVECLFGMAALAAVSLLGTLPPMLAD